MKIQFCKFQTDGFVLHKITGDFKGRASAWFNPLGELADCEQILPNNQTRPIKKGGKLWNYLATFGPRYVGKE